MIHVIVEYDSKQNRYKSFHTSGHAEYADEGYDIICSAVSAIIITTINSIDELTEDQYSFSEHQEEGMMHFDLQGEISHEANVLLSSMIIGLKGISSQYGNEYLKVDTKEV